jgi:signal transduction histidine kinase
MAAAERDDFSARPRPVPVGALIDDARMALEAHAPSRPPVIVLEDVDLDALVMADPDRIGQVLRNLLGNAVKFSPRETSIALRVSTQGTTRVRLEVIDEGPGIHPDDVPRIFEKFWRGRNGKEDGRVEEVAGAGIGLYLSRRIMRAHGSDISVRSTPGAGSAFGFELDLVHEHDVPKAQ